MSRHPVTGRTTLLAGAACAATALYAFAAPVAASDGQAGVHVNTQAAAGVTVTAARVRGAARQYTLTPRQRQQVERLRDDAESELIRSGSETRSDGGDPAVREYLDLLDDLLAGRRPYGDLTPPPWQEPAAVTAVVSGHYARARLNLPGTGIGFQRDTPASGERFGAATSRSGFAHAYGATIEIPALSQPPTASTVDGRARRQPAWSLGFRTTRESQNELTQIAAGGTGESGFVYGALSPSGSSGINVSNFGSAHEARTEWRAWDVSGTYAFQGFDSLACAQLFITLYYASMVQDFDGWSQHAGGGISIEQGRDQRASNQRYGFNIGVRAGGRPGDISFGPFIPFVKATAGLANTRSSLRSEETVNCNICPPADQSFTINTTDSRRDWDFTGSLSAGVNLPISESASFTLSAGYEHSGRVGAIWNPSSGDQVFFDGRTTELQRVNYHPRYVAFGVRLQF
jgi:hypothetical protein